MSWVTRKEIPMAIFAITFLISCFAYYLQVPLLGEVQKGLMDWVLVVVTFAIGTGLASLALFHGGRIKQKSKGYPMSIVIFAALVFMFIACVVSAEARGYWYGDVYTALATAMLSFTAFYNYTAIYRAFKIRNSDAAVFAVAAILLIMLYAPIYELAWPASAQIASWLLDVPSMGAHRGVIIGVAVGILALAVRILLGYERPYGG